MKISKLIKILRAEDKQFCVPTELLRDTGFNLRGYLAQAFSARMARNLDFGLLYGKPGVKITNIGAPMPNTGMTHYVGDGCCDFCGGHGQNCAACDNAGRDDGRKKKRKKKTRKTSRLHRSIINALGGEGLNLGPMQLKSAKKKTQKRCTCRGGNSGCPQHQHSDR